MLRLALFLVSVVFAVPTLANVAGDMRVIGDAAKTRFVVDLERSPEFIVRRLMNPYRLIVNMPEVEFTAQAKPNNGRGLIKDYRYGLMAPGKARIVLDLVGPVEIVNTFVLDPSPAEPARFVIDLVPTTAPEFEAAVAAETPGNDLVGAPRRSANRLAPDRPVVVIDAGHGGIDSGAIGKDGLLEKDLTLEFAIELARQLKLGGKIEPVLTRDSDTSLALEDRVDVAEQHKAALFISIHADSVKQDYVRGATIYTLSEDASDALAAAAADRENRSDVLAGFSLEDQPDEVADILVDFGLRDTRRQSVGFAKSLVASLDGSIPLNSHPWRRGAFVVLKVEGVPSVLFELGYLSNKEDEAMFRSGSWPGSEARNTARAIEAFFGSNVTAGQ